MADKSDDTWQTSRQRGFWRWFLLLGPVFLLLTGLDVLITGKTPLLGFAYGAAAIFLYAQLFHARIMWNEHALREITPILTTKEGRWDDLNKMKKGPFGFGRTFYFGKTIIYLTVINAGLSLKNYYDIQDIAERKLRENA